MRHWGMVVTGFYLAVVAVLAGFSVLVFYPEADWSDISEHLFDWGLWMWIAILVGSQLILIGTRVARTTEPLEPQRDLRKAYAAAAFAAAILSVAALASLGAAVFGDDVFDYADFDSFLSNSRAFETESWGLAYFATILAPLLGFWAVWWFILKRYSAEILNREGLIFKWLFRGSVLELLISVPSQVIVQRREDCSAPVVTSYGVATGVALMFMSFGPAILKLYEERIAIAEKKLEEDSGPDSG